MNPGTDVFNIELQIMHDLRQKQDMAVRMTADSALNFYSRLPGWKVDVLFTQQADQKAKNLPVPLPPPAPLLWTVDEAIHRRICTERLTTRQSGLLEFDWAYFRSTPVLLPEGTMDLTPKNKPTPGPPPNKENPIGKPYPGQPGVFRFVGDPYDFQDHDQYEDAAGTDYAIVRQRASIGNQDPKPIFLWEQVGVGNIPQRWRYVYE